MILDTEQRERFVTQAFVGVVVEVEMRDFDIAGGQRLGVHAESVVLRGDLHFFAEQILYGMIRTVMACLLYTSRCV